MKFKITYQIGTSLREKIINAKSLEEAEELANFKFKKWVDILYVDYSNAKLAHGGE